MAYAGVERHAALYTQGVPTGRGHVSRETMYLVHSMGVLDFVYVVR